jgi:proline iminopeptidase
MAHRRIRAAATLAMAAYAVARRRMVRWGATDGEIREEYPGSGLVPGGERGATLATTIEAPPERVWPWLVQMGCDRAGWYSWDRLDNAGRPSAETIHPEWQGLTRGDRLASTPGGRSWFVVEEAVPERFLALRATFDGRGRPLDPAAPRPRVFTDTTWCFLLRALPGGRTRLIVSGYDGGQPRWLRRLAGVLVWEPAHWIMQTRQLRNLRARAERPDAAAPAVAPAAGT